MEQRIWLLEQKVLFRLLSIVFESCRSEFQIYKNQKYLYTWVHLSTLTNYEGLKEIELRTWLTRDLPTLYRKRLSDNPRFAT